MLQDLQLSRNADVLVLACSLQRQVTARSGEGSMNGRVERQTVDLSQYPDLVVIYLGMRVNAWTGLKTLIGMQPSLKGAIKAKPDGLLLHEEMLFSMAPPHVAMRQYWRDYASLEAWTR